MFLIFLEAFLLNPPSGPDGRCCRPSERQRGRGPYPFDSSHFGPQPFCSKDFGSNAAEFSLRVSFPNIAGPTFYFFQEEQCLTGAVLGERTFDWTFWTIEPLNTMNAVTRLLASAGHGRRKGRTSQRYHRKPVVQIWLSFSWYCCKTCGAMLQSTKSTNTYALI